MRDITTTTQYNNPTKQYNNISKFLVERPCNLEDFYHRNYIILHVFLQKYMTL